MDDLISRQAVLKLPRNITRNLFGEIVEESIDVKRIEALASAQPERKSGKWIHGREIAREMIGDAIVAILYDGWQCSECKCIVEEEREPLWNFYPNCGANMKGERDERDS